MTRPLNQDGIAFVEVVVTPALLPRRSLTKGSVATPPRGAILGLVDPGAAISAIDSQLVRALNLTPFALMDVVTPHSAVSLRLPEYKVDLSILAPLGGFLVTRQALAVVGMPLLQMGSEVLVGCDVLADGQFIHNGFSKTFSLAF